MRRNPSLASLIVLSLLAACVGPPERPAPSAPPPAPRPVSAPAQAPAPVPAAPAPVTTEWQYRPAAPGGWTYRPGAGGSSALFGLSAADPRLTLRCDRAARRISLTRAGAGQGPMTVRTSYGATNWPATPAAGQVAQLTAVRAASDAVLDQLAYSRGRFAIEVQGQEALIVPAWAEVARVIEDCRG